MNYLGKLRWFISDGLDDYDESIKVSEIWLKVNELIKLKEDQENETCDDWIHNQRVELNDDKYCPICGKNLQP